MNLPEALGLPLRGHRHALEPGDNESHIAVIRLRDGARIGSVDLQVEGDTLQLRSVCIDEGQRGWGGGTEAVQLLLAAASRGLLRATAVAPADVGLAVYFWVRMGFSPRFGTGPGGGLLFERDLG